MAPRIKRVYRKRTSSIGIEKGNDLSFLSLYREEKKQQMGGNGDEEVKRMREELRERERLMMRDLNAFKAQAWKPKVEVRDVRRAEYFKDTKDIMDAKDAKDVKDAKDLYNDERTLDDKVDTVDRHDSLPISTPVKLKGFNEHLLQSFLQLKHHLSSDAYSFISNSPIVTESRILDGSFALINDFPSSSPMVPGSSRIASPEGVYRTSERTSPIKDDDSDKGVEDMLVDYGMDDEGMNDAAMDEIQVEQPNEEVQPKPTTRRTRKVTFNCRQRRRNRRSSKRQERVEPNRTKRQDKSFKTRRKRQTISSPPNSPLPGGHSLSIDPEFLESYPGIWMKRLPVPLTVSPSASPDHFFGNLGIK